MAQLHDRACQFTIRLTTSSLCLDCVGPDGSISILPPVISHEWAVNNSTIHANIWILYCKRAFNMSQRPRRSELSLWSLSRGCGDLVERSKWNRSPLTIRSISPFQAYTRGSLALCYFPFVFNWIKLNLCCQSTPMRNRHSPLSFASSLMWANIASRMPLSIPKLLQIAEGIYFEKMLLADQYDALYFCSAVEVSLACPLDAKQVPKFSTVRTALLRLCVLWRRMITCTLHTTQQSNH